MKWKLLRWPAGGLAVIAAALGGGLGAVAAANADERRIGRGRPDTPPSGEAREAGHEVEDFSGRDVGMVMAVIAVTVAILISGVFYMTGHLTHGDHVRYSSLTAQQTRNTAIPLPHLEVHPLADYRAYRAHQLHRISHYYRLGGGYARIPINRAMTLLRGKSLDQPAGAQPAGAQPAGAKAGGGQS
jgi:hypothetical protein